MKIYIQLNKDCRLVGWGSTRGKNSDVELDVPNDHEVLRNPFVFKYANGNLLKDEGYHQQLIDKLKNQQNQPSAKEEIALLKKQNADLIFNLMLKGVI